MLFFYLLYFLYRSILNYICFILEGSVKPVNKRFSGPFCVQKGCNLCSFWVKDVYKRGVTCVVIRLKKCTFEVSVITLKVH